MSSMNLKRPKRIGEEDEDDLLRIQEEFLKSKIDQPAAKVIKKQPRKDESNLEQEETHPISEQPQQPGKSKSLEIDLESDDKALNAVLTDIIEKPPVALASLNAAEVSQMIGKGQVPKIEKINFKELSKNLGSEKRKTKSLFALNLERQGKLKSYFPLDQIIQPSSLSRDEKLKQIEEKILIKKNVNIKPEQMKDEPNVSNEKLNKQLITGEGLGNLKDVETIHLENLEKLSKMKQEEILSEQEKLMQQLDPKIVAFIRRKNLNNKQNESLGDRVTQKPNEISLSSSANDELKENVLNELPFKPDKKWLHMDKIEYDKLEWMIGPKNVLKKHESTTAESSGSASAARFDFSGNLISPDTDVPITKALHHHGNDPDAAGYTLDELFHLARSKFNQQRVLAIQTLGNILEKCHIGFYHGVIKSGTSSAKQETKFSFTDTDGSKNEDDDDDDDEENDKHNLLNQLVEGGILFLLRLSLDDQTESIINVSLVAIKNLLQPFEQEHVLDSTFDLFNGHQMPCLHPFSAVFEQQQQSAFKLDKHLSLNEQKDLNELTDEEYILNDLVKGLFRMNLMARIYYLLDKYKPSITSNQIVTNIFQIIFRCLRHSPEIAYEVVEKNSNLIKLIIRNYLPMFISNEQLTDQFSLTHTANTIKLLRLISSSGSHMAFKLYKTFELDNRLTSYLAYFDTQTLEPNTAIELLKLQIESVRLIKVLLIYSNQEENDSSSSLAIDLIENCFEIFLKHLNNLTNKLLSSIQTSNLLNEQHVLLLQSLISLFTCLSSTLNNNNPKYLEKKYEMSSGVYLIVQSFLIQQFRLHFFSDKQTNTNTSTNKPDLNLMSVCLNYLVDYLEMCGNVDVYSLKNNNRDDSLTKRLSLVENLIEKILKPFLVSEETSSGNTKSNKIRLDDLVLSKLIRNSTCSSEDEVKKSYEKIIGNNLSYLPTIVNLISDNKNNDESNINMVKRLEPFCFMTSFLRLYSICFKLRVKYFDNENFTKTRLFLNSSYLKSYLKSFTNSISQQKNSINNSYLIMKHENYLVYHCLKLAFSIFNLEDNDSLVNEETVKSKDQMDDPDDESQTEENSKDLVKLFEEKRFYYLLSLSLMLKLKPGDECFVYDIISTCLFNMNIWSIYLMNNSNNINIGQSSSITEKLNQMSIGSSFNFLLKYFEQMSLSENTKSDLETSKHNENNVQIEFNYLNTSFSQSETIKINKNFIKLMESVHIYENLNQIKFIYLENGLLIDAKQLEHSRLLNNFTVSSRSNFKLNNLFSSSARYSNRFLLRSDWIYAPIVSSLRQTELKLKSQPKSSAEVTINAEKQISKLISSIANSLKFIYLLEIYLSDYLDLCIEVTHRYVNLLYVYLFDTEIFLDKQIVTYLYLIYFKFVKDKKKPLENLNLNGKIPGLMSFYDFYQNLLSHYDSTSFGDYLFSLYMIVPLQQFYPIKFRQLFWSDYFHLFKYMTFATNTSKLLIPLKNFIQPNEKSLHMIRLYCQIILDPNDFDLISRSKLAYTILVSHINSFIFEHTNKIEHKLEFDFKKLLVQKFLSISNKKLKNDVLNFKMLDAVSEDLVLFEELPNLRKQWLSQLLD